MKNISVLFLCKIHHRLNMNISEMTFPGGSFLVVKRAEILTGIQPFERYSVMIKYGLDIPFQSQFIPEAK